MDSKGYPQFRMSLPGGRQKIMKVHRAVALAFIGPRPDGYQVNHRSGDKLDNSVANLEYVTCRRNIRHAWRTGLYRSEHSRGEKNPFAKLTDEDVQAIRQLSASVPIGQLATQFGVTRENIWQIVKRKTWKHVA